MALLQWCLAQVEGCWTRGDEKRDWGAQLSRDHRLQAQNERLTEQRKREAEEAERRLQSSSSMMLERLESEKLLIES